MWLFNVVREIYKLADFEVYPEDVPQSDGEMMSSAQQASRSNDPCKKWVLKVHTVIRSNLARTKVITTHRDPRDICISFMEFMHANFDKALEVARQATEIAQHYKTYDPGYLKMVAYADIERNPEAAILDIAAFLGVPLKPEQAHAIAETFSRAKVRQRIERHDKKLSDQIRKGKPVDPNEVVRLSPTNVRAFDRQTGFQSGHVSTRQTGDWARVLPDAQRAILATEFADWLAEFGYQT
jgi:hypothetical protein